MISGLPTILAPLLEPVASKPLRIVGRVGQPALTKDARGNVNRRCPFACLKVPLYSVERQCGADRAEHETAGAPHRVSIQVGLPRT